jgi:N-methylhydantoinase B
MRRIQAVIHDAISDQSSLKRRDGPDSEGALTDRQPTVAGTRDEADEHLPIALELLRNGLTAIADEMAIVEVRTSYSPILRDLLDFSTAVCDEHGRVLAQGLTLAVQLGGIPRYMTFVMERVPNPRRGDVYLANDPWQGGLHLSDFCFARPVFADGEETPIAWIASVTHMIDVGGRFPGSISVTSTSLWEEGLVIPIIPIVQEGVQNQTMFDVIAANSREPSKVQGDIRAALAALEIGHRQVLEMANRLGSSELRRQMVAFLDHSELKTRAALERIPDGSASAVGFLDDDGCGGPPVEIHCRVDKRGDHLSFDFTGTASQLATGINCTLGDVIGICAFVAGAAIGEDTSVNEGFTRCIDFTIPDGTVASARRPAAVNSRGMLLYGLSDVAVAAMSSLVPNRLPAGDAGPMLVRFSGVRADGALWLVYDLVHAGWGAMAGHDGVVGVSHAIVNSGNNPIETLEHDYPLRVTAFEFIADTGGAGTYTGAPSVAREYEALADGVDFDQRVERQKFPPKGLNGGADGTPARCLLARRGGEWEDIPAKCAMTLNKGDRLRIELSGGGGYGPPSGRDPDAVADLVHRGFVSAAKAAAVYGA